MALDRRGVPDISFKSYRSIDRTQAGAGERWETGAVWQLRAVIWARSGVLPRYRPGWKGQGKPCCWFDNKKLSCFVIRKIMLR